MESRPHLEALARGMAYPATPVTRPAATVAVQDLVAHTAEALGPHLMGLLRTAAPARVATAAVTHPHLQIRSHRSLHSRRKLPRRAERPQGRAHRPREPPRPPLLQPARIRQAAISERPVSAEVTEAI